MVLKSNEIRSVLGCNKLKKVVPAESIDEEGDAHPFFNSIYPEESKLDLNYNPRSFHTPYQAPLGDNCPINTVRV